MANDVAPQLKEQIDAILKQKLETSEIIKHLNTKLQDGSAGFADAHNYATAVGDIITDALGETVTSEVLPDGKMYFNIAERIIRPVLEDDYNRIATYSVAVQELENKQRGIGLKAIKPELENDRIEGIVNRVSSEQFEDVAWILGDPVVNFSQSVVDDVIKTNCDMQKRAGLEPKIIRKAVIKCCDWCSNLEGTYIYGTEPHDVYRRHENCRCLVELAKGNFRQNAHTKQSYQVENAEEIQERINAIEGINDFKPAKTIPEAEEFARQFVDESDWMAQGVSYKGISLECANEINETVATFYNNFDTEKLAGIVAPAKNTRLGKQINGAVAGYAPVTNNLVLNKDVFKNAKTVKKQLDENNTIARQYLENPEEYLKKYNVSNRVKQVLENCKDSGRATYPTNIKEAINHELGHKMQRHVFGHPLWDTVEQNKEKYASKISGYATTADGEYIAESFSAYMNGETIIDPVLVDIFNSFRR